MAVGAARCSVRSAPKLLSPGYGPRAGRIQIGVVSPQRIGRGVYQLGPSVLVSGDVFGWHPAQRSESARQRVVVYPRIVPIAQLGLPARSPFPSLPTPIPLFEDPNRLIGVRAYQTGDSARRIHWPASAHGGELLVRKLQPAWGRDTVVLLDTGRDSLGGLRQGTLELSVTAAASILYHVVANEGQPAGLRIPQMTLTPSSGHNHLMAMLEVLAGVGVAGASTELSQPLGLPFGATLVVVTGKLNERWANDLLLLQQRGFRPTVLLTGPDTDEALGPPGIRVRSIAHHSALYEALA